MSRLVFLSCKLLADTFIKKKDQYVLLKLVGGSL